MSEKKGKIRAINSYLIIEDIIEKKVIGKMSMTGSDTQHLRAKKAKVIDAGEVTTVKAGEEIYYDAARTFKVIVEGYDSPLTIIRINEVVAVI